MAGIFGLIGAVELAILPEIEIVGGERDEIGRVDSLIDIEWEKEGVELELESTESEKTGGEVLDEPAVVAEAPCVAPVVVVVHFDFKIRECFNEDRVGNIVGVVVLDEFWEARYEKKWVEHLRDGAEIFGDACVEIDFTGEIK